jgi:hypothetical protein
VGKVDREGRKEGELEGFWLGEEVGSIEVGSGVHMTAPVLEKRQSTYVLSAPTKTS